MLQKRFPKAEAQQYLYASISKHLLREITLLDALKEVWKKYCILLESTGN